VVRWLASLLLIASAASAMAASPATPSYTQQRFIARGSDALRAGPAVRNDSDSVRQPYPSRYYSDVSRGIKGCGWLMDRAIRTNHKNWLQRYRACSE
jgi:hypothetical protein